MPRGYGGMEPLGRSGSAELPVFKRLHGVSALQARSGPALPHAYWMQYPAAIASAGPTPDQDLQALGAHLAKHCRPGP